MSSSFLHSQSFDGLLFNRGLLINVGFVEAMADKEDWDCIIFHDVDLLPEIPINAYECWDQVREHLPLLSRQLTREIVASPAC